MVTRQERLKRLLFEGNFVHLTRARALRTLVGASAERFESVSDGLFFTLQHCVWSYGLFLLFLSGSSSTATYR